MSYYTRFELKISISSVGDKTEHREAKCLILQKLGSLGLEEIGGFAFSTKGGIKWYDHEYEMAEISSQFPSVEFVLEGQGEKPEDVWRKIFLGGKMRHIKPILLWPDPETVDWQEFSFEEDSQG